jgi:hypothetical protein
MTTSAREIAIDAQDPSRIPVITVSGRMQIFPGWSNIDRK